MIGKTLSHFRIDVKLGAGGMGEVYRAHDERLDRDVAVKVLPADAFTDETARKRFRKEALALSKLNHPNIATIYDFDTQDGVDFLVMEYVRGTTLSEKVSKGALPEKEIAKLGGQVADALEEAHEQGIIHRDLKPANVMVTAKGRAKVLDFGIAKLLRPEGETTLGGTSSETRGVAGTLPYMAPEQLQGEAVDGRTDLYALGVVLYEASTGRRPFSGETVPQLTDAILHETPVTPRATNARVSPDLERIILKCLEKDAENRYQSAKDIEVDLRRLGSSPSAVAQAVPERTSQRNVMIAAMALMGVLLLSAVGFLIYQRTQSTTTESPQSTPVQRPLTQLTFDSGLQAEPTFSPDGRFIAYSSDKSGNFDIWVRRPMGGGDAVQITKDPAHDWQPDWSPDGNLIAFRSERGGGGLFTVPALGGLERKISSVGYYPQWSPDGSRILFRTPLVRSGMLPPKLFVLSLDGNPPGGVLVDLPKDIGRLNSLTWHPDGQRISILGGPRGEERGFWTIDLADGAQIKSEFAAEVEKQIEAAGLATENARKFIWEPTGRALYFEGVSRGVRNFWKVTVEPETLRWVRGPDRLTTGAGPDTDMALSTDGEKLAFTTRTERTRIWSLPFDAATGQIRGEGQAVTPPGLNARSPDLSRDGKKLVFTLSRAGQDELWQKSLEDGRETLLAADGFRRAWPRWSPDGNYLAYRRINPTLEERSIVLMPAGGGEEQILTSPRSSGAENASDWSPDGSWVLAESSRNPPGIQTPGVRIWLLPVSAAPQAETQGRVVAHDPEYNLAQSHFSPNGKWIAFIAISTVGATPHTIYVIPASGGDWIPITEGRYIADKPRWSPDGKTIYFLSPRGGFLNVWGRRFDPAQGKPLGQPFQVTAIESPNRMMPLSLAPADISLSADRLVLRITEVTGNLWMLENVDR